MSISLIKQPDDFGRVFDTNRLIYQFYSTQWQQPNFQFQFVLKYYTYDGAVKELGTYNVYPLSGGTCEFNPSSIYRNFVKEEINLSDTTLKECKTMALRFQLTVYEYYSSPSTVPPIRYSVGGSSWTESVHRTYFNGCQQPIPYDYIPLNPDGNILWVMSGSTTGGGGKFLTDANRYELDNDDYLFLYALGDNVSGRPDKIRYKVWHSTWHQGPSNTGIGGGGNGLSLDNSTDGQENLQMSLPTIKSKNIATGGDSSYIGGGGGGGISIIQSHSAITMTTLYDDNFSFDYTNTRAYRFPCGPKQLIDYNGVLSGYTNTWIRYEIDLVKNGSYNDYCYSNTITANLLMPAGSMIYENQDEGFALLSSVGVVIDGDVSHPGTGPWSHRSGPVYYSKTSSSLLTLNRVPFQVFKKDKCGRYDKVQIFWENIHGGFDTYTFSAKKEINNKINRTTYKQKLPTTSYSPYDAGERVFNVNYQTEYTLRTTQLTQMESQLLMGLTVSPVVYMLQTFYYNGAEYPYGLPMIITTDGIKYEQKKNDKIIFMEIKMRPSNENIIQNG
jgi:hypothetical protein